MQKRNLCLMLCLFSVCMGEAQPWDYDFGTSASSHSMGVSTTFLPDPPSGSDRVRVGSTGGGFVLQNPGLTSLGSGTELKISAPTSGSVNKFSISDYTQSTVFSTSFDVLFGNNSGASGASSGVWYFFQGDGASFSDNNGFTGAHVFVGLRFQFSPEGVTLNYRSGGNWVTTGLLTTMLEQGLVYSIEIYGNNSSLGQTYNAGSQSLAAYKFDLWINGTKFGDDLSKAELSNGNNIDSWMFYGENSTSNVAHIFLDDFIYSNTLSALLPVELTNFDVTNTEKEVALSWSTATELNNDYFQIERGSDGRTFEIIGQVAGAGTHYGSLNYAFWDQTPLPGWNYYRLKQVDLDGQYVFSAVRAVRIDQQSRAPERLSFFPNPADSKITLSDQSRVLNGNELEVFNQFGRIVLQLKASEIQDTSIDLSEIPTGLYFARMQTMNGLLTGIFVVKR